MKILALETSAKAVSAAVTEGGRVLALGFQDTGLTHSRTLMPIVEHILKNAAIPIVHGIPGSILAALTGAIITERVYVVPGAGNLLTEAINKYDNGVIVGVTLFYAVLSVASIILGDILMATVDPRISFTTKDR